MINTVLIVGRVEEVAADRDAVIVVVSTGRREYKGKVYEDKAACRFYGKATEHANKAQPGAFVKVDGKVTSRQSDRGGWFSGIEARFLEVLPEEGKATSGAKHTRTAASAAKDDEDDGANLPF